MNWTYLILGIILLITVLLDALWTTLWSEGVAGPVSSRVARVVWQAWRSVVPVRAHRALSLSGPLVLSAVVAVWVALMWAGWTLVFSAQKTSLLSTMDHTPPDTMGRLYFAAMAVFTMGNGDFAPQGSTWQVATALANANGLLVLTLVISYVLSVLSAVVQKRLLAREVAALGSSGPEFVLAGWNGKNFRDLDLPLNTITSRLGQLTEQHLAYPILHYYHSREREASSVLAVAILEDALAILLHAVAEQQRPAEATLRSTRAALQNFHETLNSAFVRSNADLPPAPGLQPLRQEGVTVGEEAVFPDEVARQRADARRQLHGAVTQAGWSWPASR